MTRHEKVFLPEGQDSTQTITKLVIMAVGGQGGGVLTNWIEALARTDGRAVQATSVAGVAQRTGATIYYIEIAPEGVESPVFSLAPAAGDVDILIAAELMEAGRAVQRGFVTPDRTVLIASDHRSLAVSEKMVPGDGIAQGDAVKGAAEIAARSFLIADMEQLAVARGSVISASLFGALAGSGALPFARDQFEAAIRRSGKGVDASLAAFAAGYESITVKNTPAATGAAVTNLPTSVSGPVAEVDAWRSLQKRLKGLPDAAQGIAQAGLEKVVAFQDTAYGAAYIDRVESVAAQDDPVHEYILTQTAAKYIANAMAYDDVIRVADLKTRAVRFARIDDEMGRQNAQLLHLTEFFHPRAEEIIGMLPARWGARIEASAGWTARLDRWFNRGRRIRTDRLRGFLPLYVLAGLRAFRPLMRRHQVEMAHLEHWLSTALAYRKTNYALAVEVLCCRRLIKGYSDTHARGLSKFDKVLAGIGLVEGREDSADWARRLRDAALQDEKGDALDGALATIRSFSAG